MPIYRLFATLIAPVLGALGLWRVLRGREARADLAERLGAGPGRPGALWLHGASNGELTAARRLIEALRAAFPDRPLLITSNTASARGMVRGWNLSGTHAHLAPVDLRWVLARFRARWRPAVLITLENEIWPNRIVTSPVPVVVVAARMSERTARTWARFGRLARRVLPHIARLYPQDAASGARLISLGLPEDRLAPVARLKSGVSLAPPGPDALRAVQAVFPHAHTVLGASTHEGDEALILRAFTAARAECPDLRLILAPRHPRRSAEVEALVRETGLPYAVRSRAPGPDAACVLYIADTLGEMPLWYSAAGITVVGGSFSDRGGHTPFEPVQFGSAVIHGPDVANFAESYAALQQDKAAKLAGTAPDLARALIELTDPGARQALSDRAEKTLAALDDSAETIRTIIADLKERIG